MKNKFLLLAFALILGAISSFAQVGHWRLNNNANDETVNAINGTLAGGASFTTDAIEGSHALNLTGASQYVNLGNPAALPSGTSARSISVWAKTNTVATGNRVIVSYGTNATSSAMFIGQNGATLNAGGYSNNLSQTNFWTVGVWHHICLTYDGTTAVLYADGVQVTSSARTWNLTLLRAYIGRDVNNSRYWNGAIDEVRIFDSALTPSEVAALATLPPQPPGNLAANVAGVSAVSLSWSDASNDETGFEIERSVTSGSGFSLIATTAPNIITYLDTNLSQNTTYYYRVRSINSAGGSPYTAEASVLVPVTPPLPPNFLAASLVSPTEINLTWNDRSNNETSFEILRSITLPNGLNTGYSIIATLPSNTTSFLHSNVLEDRIYFYKVRAVNSGGGNDSEETSVSTPLSLPISPTGLQVLPLSTASIELRWIDNAFNEGGYEIERSLTSGAGYESITSVAQNTNTFLDGGLTRGETYYYRIRAFNSTGNSSYTPEVAASTFAIGEDIIWANFVNSSAVSTTLAKDISTTAWDAGAKSTQVINDGQNGWVEFNANPTISFIVGLTSTDPDASYQSIEYGIRNNAGTLEVYESGTQINSFGTLQANDRLRVERVGSAVVYKKNGTIFYTSLTASSGNLFVDASIESPIAVITGTIVYLAPPPPSAIQTVSVSKTQVDLTWQDNSTDETGFEIERSLTSGGGFSLITTTAPDAVSYSDMGLTEGTIYYYRLRAVNLGGSSPFSLEAVGETIHRPATPTNLTATVNSPTSVSLNWTDVADNETSFEIERSSTSGSGYALIATTPANSTSYANINLSENTSYYYRIRATNAVDVSDYTVQVSATTTSPSAPTNLSVVATSQTTATISWVDTSGSETGFEVERSTTSGSGFSLINTAAANASSYGDSGLAPNTKYFYRIRAINASNQSEYTLEFNITTPQLPPNTPTDLVITAQSSTSSSLTWTDASSNEEKFEIERSTTSGSAYTLVKTTLANVASYVDQNLSAGTTYYYRIRAVNSGGVSPYTSESLVGLPIEGSSACGNVFCNENGSVGIGTPYVPEGYRMSVNGKIMAEGVKVLLQSEWPDYVFGLNYELQGIPELKSFIEANGHLPNVPSAETVAKEGIDIGEMNKILLEKIEELSLYLIQLEEKLQVLEVENEKLKSKGSK